VDEFCTQEPWDATVPPWIALPLDRLSPAGPGFVETFPCFGGVKRDYKLALIHSD
jgi:hypothetical protein